MMLKVTSIPRTRLITYAFMGILIGTIIMGGALNLLSPPTPEISFIPQSYPTSLQRFTSYEHLKEYVYEFTQGGTGYWGYWGAKTRNFVLESSSQAIPAPSDAAPEDYSTTNIQVEGVDEADIIKTDGIYIYVASEDTVHIVRAFPPEKAALVSSLTFDHRVQNIYVNGDKLIVMEADDLIYLRPWPVPEDFWADITRVHIYDITDRNAPIIDRTITADGYTLSSRMIGDYVYIVTQRMNIYFNETEIWLPRFSSNDEVTEVEADMIYFTNFTDNWCSFTNFLSVNGQDHEEQIGHESFLLGPSSTLYASTKNIYITAPSWNATSRTQITKIFKITIDNRRMEYTADGVVPGTVLNQFSMDEKDGYFRIAVTQGHVTRSGEATSNDVYVLDGDLEMVGSLQGLAPGERIYSARFMGDRCYLVTFKKVDPLFTIDLSEPENPTVLGKLKIPGYSDYLHPYEENTLIGIGKETVEAEEGDFAWYQGVKISLFDVRDVENPREIAKIEIGDRGTDSQALHDHKAVLFNRERNLLVIPILVAEINAEGYAGNPPDNAYGDYVAQGAHVFHISREEGIVLRGVVSHLDDSDAFLKSGYYFDSDLIVERSLYIEDTFYTISRGMVKMNTLEDLIEIGSVDIH
jgi:uncharacterized secreted protein with C-terminal beta-propeller domain